MALYIFLNTLLRKHSLTNNGEHKFVSGEDDNDVHIRPTFEIDGLAGKASLLPPLVDSK